MTALPGTLTAWETVEGIRNGAFTSIDVVSASVERIDRREQSIHAWEYLPSISEKGLHGTTGLPPLGGSLLGVPVGIKDIIDTVDMPTRCGTALYSQRRPSWDASCVSMLKAAGATILGKTVTTELGYLSPGLTRNPKNILHTPGGSSSGSAAAVADGMVPIAIGAQTAASVIRPASFCGCIGYVPSPGHMCLSGVKSFAPSFDRLGIMARSVRDVVMVRSVLRGLKDGQETKRKLAEVNRLSNERLLRVGVWFGAELGVDLEMQQMVKDLIAAIDPYVAFVEEVTLSSRSAELAEYHEIIMAFEASRTLFFEGQFEDMVSVELLQLLKQGREVSESQLVLAYQRVDKAKRWFRDTFRQYDLILAPAAIGAAPRGLESTGSPIVSRVTQAAGLPAITLPAGTSASGLPLGIQILVAEGDDDHMLALAEVFESFISGIK